MPMTKSGGYVLDDTPVFTPAESKKIQSLLKSGKTEEVTKLMQEIWKSKIDYAMSTIPDPKKG